MTTDTLNLARLHETVQERHLEMLRARCAAQEKQIAELKEIVRSIPMRLVSARLDARSGAETKYDYRKAAHACRVVA